MKLLRLKITDPKGFRSLQTGFELTFRSEKLQDEEQGFAPFVCAGPNGCGKSNLLEVLAAIFFQLEVLRVRRSFLPETFLFDKIDNPHGIKESDGTPNAYELEYLIKLPLDDPYTGDHYAHVLVTKEPETSPQIRWLNPEYFASLSTEILPDGYCTERERDFLMPQYVIGYSSGENEILSLPFFKMRFVQFDEYWNYLKEQLPYSGHPETRMAYLDNGFSQAILLCNLLFQDPETLAPYHTDIGIEGLKEFRIIIRQSINASREIVDGFLGERIFRRGNSALITDRETGCVSLTLTKLLEPSVNSLKRCATCWYLDESSDTLYLDYLVNEATRQAFRNNFSNDPLELFQVFQVLLMLNLYTVSDRLKADLYHSESLYANETVPTLASDERIMRFKHFWIFIKDSKKPVLLKSLSDGEHQLLHTLGLCLLFKKTQCLLLLDEPETHFNPDWRANFISRLNECFIGSEGQEMLITTHAPFLISDCKPEKVMVFKKTDGVVSVVQPEYNTMGASINKITMATFDKRETIGLRAEAMLKKFRQRFEQGENKEQLLSDINHQLGDSVEKVLLIQTILNSNGGQS
ncbi:MAG: restriction system-associated AAA family ATPase [Desulfobulbaceae bacterium]|nr:restriction system-associated AAA family ATPase [Desulfobulbaceae bacterium]